MPSIKTDELVETVTKAKGFTWDGCHKIYVLMDDEQVAQSEAWGYEVSRIEADDTAEDIVPLLQHWYNESCGLRFISAVSTNLENPNLGFHDLIPQGWNEDSVS
jgi:hypothetical protein